MELSFCKADLQDCVQVSSFRIAQSGRIVIGQSLIESGSSLEENVSTDDLDAWLKDQLWLITMQLLYGDSNAIHWDNWESIQTSVPYLRPLLTYVTCYCPTFSLMSQRLSDLFESLEPLHKSKTLTYPIARSHMLQSPLIHMGYFMLPQKPMEVAIGDIGYIRGDCFIKLHNIQSDWDLKIVPISDKVNMMEASVEVKINEISDNVIRYGFEQPLYIHITRYHNPEEIEDHCGVWSHYIRDAPTILQKYGEGHNISTTDLMLVTGLWHDRRFAWYECKTKEGYSVSPPDVLFNEYQNAAPEDPWGEWLFNKDTEYEIDTGLERNLQYICFIQLEQEDS